MKIFKFVGITILVVALLFALALIGRIQTEDRYFREGEITLSQMLTDADIFRWLGVSAVIAVVGGIILALYFATDRTAVDDLFEDDPDEIDISPFSHSVVPEDGVDISEAALVGDIEIWGHPYKLYECDGYYIITSDDSTIQYWRGCMHDLKRLEAELDEH